jgi:hypothetical protein
MSKDGGAVFPSAEQLSDQHLVWNNRGMTIRQFYKAAAIQGILASMADCDEHRNIPLKVDVAALFADALIAEDEAHAGEGK